MADEPDRVPENFLEGLTLIIMMPSLEEYMLETFNYRKMD